MGWTDEARKDAISHWKSVYHAPPTKPEDPLKKGTVEPVLEEGTKLTKEVLADLSLGKVDLQTLKVSNKDASERVRRVVELVAGPAGELTH